MPLIDKKYVELPKTNKRPILNSRGPRSRKDTEVSLEIVKDKIFLMFDNHVHRAAAKGVEIDKSTIDELFDAIAAVKSYLDGKSSARELFPHHKKTEEEMMLEIYGVVPFEREESYKNYLGVDHKYKVKYYSKPKAD